MRASSSPVPETPPTARPLAASPSRQHHPLFGQRVAAAAPPDAGRERGTDWTWVALEYVEIRRALASARYYRFDDLERVRRWQAQALSRQPRQGLHLPKAQAQMASP